MHAYFFCYIILEQEVKPSYHLFSFIRNIEPNVYSTFLVLYIWQLHVFLFSQKKCNVTHVGSPHYWANINMSNIYFNYYNNNSIANKIICSILLVIAE